MTIQLSKKTLIILMLLALSAFSSGYLFWYSNRLATNQADQAEALEVQAGQISLYKQLDTIDSILFANQYRQAIESYQLLQRKTKDSAINLQIVRRLEFAQELLRNRQASRVGVTALDSSLLPITLADQKTSANISTDRQKSEDNRIDSLAFALEKAKLQAERLSSRLEKNTEGNYLTFTSSKGNETNYVGDVKDGKAHGQGVGLLSTGSRYEGTWKNNRRDGKGIFRWPDGAHYDGEYRSDQRHGEGTYFWPNGEKFVGQWKSDRRHGEGVFYGSDGKVVASGRWEDDELVDKK